VGGARPSGAHARRGAGRDVRRRRGADRMSEALAVGQRPWGRRLGAGVIGALRIALLLINLWLNPARLAPAGIVTTIGLVAPMLLAALATTPAILSGGGGIDISIGPMIGLLNVAMVRYLFMGGIEAPLAVEPIVLLAGAVLGAHNGLLAVWVLLPAIVATLDMCLVLIGLSAWVMYRPGGSVPSWLPSL